MSLMRRPLALLLLLPLWATAQSTATPCPLYGYKSKCVVEVKVAADGARGDKNSPFTEYLLRAMQQPGLRIEDVFKEVRRNVSREASGVQVRLESTSLTGFFAFRQSR